MKSASRHGVFDALRRSTPAPVPLPEVAHDDRPGSVAELERHLVRAGAVVQHCGGELDVGAALAAHPPFADARRIVCAIPGIPGVAHATAVNSDPHSFADVDVTVARGEFAVAENGAIWVTDTAVPHRALYFLAQHLVLLVPSSEIVADLHAAYARIGFGGPGAAPSPAWGGFIAGPSKTADIEQALVVGAHGPRSLLVLLH